MNEKKFCFISCVNNNQYYEECLYYIERLNVPEGYEIEVLSVEDSKSMATGYNEAMNASNAKYKIYLHQDTFIINENFLYDILYTFENNSDIGMIGVVGSKVIPTSAVWYETNHKYGKVYESSAGNLTELKFKDVEKRYEQVKIIDGLIMITQYDLPWRDDVFDGYGFYDASQSTEFIKKGYKIVIPNQDVPWIIHDCAIVKTHASEKYRKKFIDEYYKDIFPLVSILIPTYNRPEYFKLALESAINQTYKNIEIIVGDDSTNNETEKLIKNYLNKYENIRYYHNKINLGQFDNDLKLMSMSKGRYINFLMDDDLFAENKIEKMINVFIEDINKQISLVSSNRKLIDAEGKFIDNYINLISHKILKLICDKIYNGKKITEFVLKYNANIIGEPTTVLFDKTKMTEKFGCYNGRKFICNVDQATWFNLLKNGSCVVFSESLSCFRIHNNQQLKDKKNIIGGAIDYSYCILSARDNNLFMDDFIYYSALKTCYNYCKSIKNIEYNNIMKNNIEYLEKTLTNVKEKFPLVSILIPTYNQIKYLKEALESAINQNYPNIEILISDDSTNNEVEEFIKKYLIDNKNIKYVKNGPHEIDYGISNGQNLLNICNGEYVNFLFHDDIFSSIKIAKMMNCFLKNPDLVLVTSSRRLIDEDSNEILNVPNTYKRVFEQDSVVSGYDARRKLITQFFNFIGEPTTVLFKKEYIQGSSWGDIYGYPVKCNVDVALWFSLLEYGDMEYISEPLSSFRIHSTQNSNNPTIIADGIIDWYNLINVSYKKGVIKNIQEYRKVLSNWFCTYFFKDIQMKGKITCNQMKMLENAFNESVHNIFEKKSNLNKVCPICKKTVERFLPYSYKDADRLKKYKVIGSDVLNFSCPYCNCHDRERHLVKFFEKMNIIDNYIIGKRVLHIAPEFYIRKIINNVNTLEYICGDLFPIDETIEKIDITDIRYCDNYFDFIICNHVLEHVPNDIKAMSELYRVLKNHGIAILQVPISMELEKTYEDAQINTDQLRKKYFGQKDHVRIYGKDYIKRLERVGFKVNIIKSKKIFDKEDCIKFGFNNDEDFFVCNK